MEIQRLERLSAVVTAAYGVRDVPVWPDRKTRLWLTEAEGMTWSAETLEEPYAALTDAVRESVLHGGGEVDQVVVPLLTAAHGLLASVAAVRVSCSESQAEREVQVADERYRDMIRIMDKAIVAYVRAARNLLGFAVGAPPTLRNLSRKDPAPRPDLDGEGFGP